MTPPEDSKFKFHEGDEVRATATDPARGLLKGQLYIVELAYDLEPEWSEPMYSLCVGPYSGKEGWESQLELTRTSKQMRDRKLPTPLDIIKAAPLSGWDYDSGFDLTESDIGGETDAIEYYGMTEEGLPFGFRLRVEWVHEVDPS